MANTKKKTYTPAPTVPIDVEPRYRAVLEVMSGTTTVAEAARSLGMSRNHFQTLMHRSLEAMIQGLTPAPPGRPPKPEREVELEAERDKLLRKTEQLEQRLDMTTKLMGLASELMKGSAPRTRTKKKSAAVTTTSPDDDSEEPPTSLRALVRQLETLELPRAVIARTIALPESTLRRWSKAPVAKPVVRAVPPPAAVLEAAVRDVRELRGLVGADSLSHKYPELSRRQAALVKQATLTAMERERRAACSRVAVVAPGVVRGFDAMERGHNITPRYVLVAADGCVPFRTSVSAVHRYDDDAVARFLDNDFTQYGAPLVLRLDRAKAHTAPKTVAVLAAHGVLVMQGPPRYPRFYGQLERQNREHEAWVHTDNDDVEPFDARVERMKTALNVLWRRRALDWKTPADVWKTKPTIDVDRAELRARVDDYARKLHAVAPRGTMTEDLARRLAVEHALTNLGYLRVEIRRPALGDRQVVKQAI